MGIVAQHASQVDDVSGPGGTSTERLARSFRAALNDPNVKAIVFNVDSPGGSVSGVQALADEIFAARGRKPMVAQVNSLMASAAYWIGAALDEIVIAPGATAGSIGVYSLHADVSQAAEASGVKYTFISAGKYKVEGNQFEPLSSEAAQAAQRLVDAYYADFTKSVAKFRGVDQAAVINGFGEGRVEKDSAAVKAGLADSIGTLDQTISRLAKQRKKISGAAAEAYAASVSVKRAEDGAVCFTGDMPTKFSAAAELISDVALPTHHETLGAVEITIDGESDDGSVVYLSASFAHPPEAQADKTELNSQQDDGRDWRRRRHALRSRGA